MLRFQLTLSQSTAKMCAHASICAWTCENQSKNIYACLDLRKSLHKCLLKKIRLLQFAQIFSKTLAHGRICALICANPCARFDLRFNLRKSQRKFSRKSCSHPSSFYFYFPLSGRRSHGTVARPRCFSDCAATYQRCKRDY